MEIGKTRAGTIIEYRPNQTTEEFSDDIQALADPDKFDFYCVYQWLTMRGNQQPFTEPDDYDWWRVRVGAIRYLAGEDLIEREKLKANIRTSYEMVQLGIKMCNNFWRKP